MGGLSLPSIGEHSAMTGKQVSDEEILNVFRISDRPFMLTNDVVDDVAIEERAVQKRLKQLEEEDRLEYQEAGQAHIWWLADGEPTDPVGTRGARLLRAAMRARRLTSIARLVATSSGGIAVFVMLSYLFLAELPNSQIPFYTKTEVVELAFIAAIVAAAGIVIWGALGITAYFLPRIAANRTQS